MIYRSEEHLRLARLAPRCMGCGRFNNGEVVAAHANHLDKGMAMKAPDYAWAALGTLCCHAELDQGSAMSREERRAFWERAYWLTQQWLWTSGLLCIAAEPVEHINAPKKPSAKIKNGRKLQTGRALPQGRKLQGGGKIPNRPWPGKAKP